MPSNAVPAFFRTSMPPQDHDGDLEDQSSRREESESSDNERVNETPSLSKRKRLSGLTSKTKAKTKRLFKVDGAAVDDETEPEEDGAFDNMERDPAFNTSALVKKRRFRAGKMTDKTLSNIKSMGKAVVHPVDSIKSKATRTTAGQLSKADRPFISQKADMEYLEAHDNLKQAESTSSSRQGTSDEDQDYIVGGHREKIREMEAYRESLRAAWITSRHVRRVRVVPKRHLNVPDNEYFVERDKDGEFLRYDWLSWLGHNLVYYTQDFSTQYIDDFDELPFDIDSSRHHVERLVMASAPWQSWLMDVRSVYRWESTRTTGKWFAVYLLLWYTQHMMGFLYCYIIYIVLKNRFFPTSVESIRESMRKAVDSQGTASKLGELIDKHGRNDWLDPLIESLGPQIQLQLGDLANMLEVFSNFYHWKYPKKTTATLYFFTSCLLVSIFADMAFCMKIVWFIVGGSFFLCWPIASLYPRYRYLVSPFKWVLWDIPTHSEWSFQYLRRQAQVMREQLIKEKVEKGHYHDVANPASDRYTGNWMTVPRIQVEGNESAEDHGESDDDGWYSASSTASVLEASDIRSFRAQSQGSVGRLIVFSKGIRYVRSFPKKEVWRLNYLDLAEMRKAEGSTVSKLASLSPNQLEIKCIDGHKFHLDGMKERDEAFNTIIAFSSLQWQSLQILKDSNAQA